ncbi:hypothetical protein FRC17_010086 [Serendipita sp. 399]|nr:hypothetical protein FRC17_010086 [Serendipita sp. 399]
MQSSSDIAISGRISALTLRFQRSFNLAFPGTIEESKKSLMISIQDGRAILLFVLRGTFTQTVHRMAEEAGGMEAMKSLTDRIEEAETTLATIDFAAAGSSLQIQEHLRRLTTALVAFQTIAIAASTTEYIDATSTSYSVFQVTAESLRGCFWDQPFGITVEAVSKRINHELGRGLSAHLNTTPLILFHFYQVIPERLNEISRLAELRDCAREWVRNQLSEPSGSLVQIGVSVTQMYTPYKPVANGVDWMTDAAQMGELFSELADQTSQQIGSSAEETLRFAVCGPHEQGKTTLLNVLIGQLLLNSGDIIGQRPADWPVIIQHCADIEQPVLTLYLQNFEPLIRAFEDHGSVHDITRTNRLFSLDKTATIETSDKNDVQSYMDCIAELVQEYSNLPLGSRSYPFNDHWPILRVRMSAFKDITRKIEFIDLPPIDSTRVNITNAKVQWQTAINACDGGIYVIRADDAVVTRADIQDGFHTLSEMLPEKPQPWITIATASERHKSSRRTFAHRFNAISRPIRPFGKSMPLSFCSPLLYRGVNHVLSEVRTNGTNEPDMSRLLSNDGKLALELALGHFTGWDSKFEPYLEEALEASGFDLLLTTLNQKLVDRAIYMRQKDALHAYRCGVEQIRAEYRYIIPFCEDEAERVHSSFVNAACIRSEEISKWNQQCKHLRNELIEFCITWRFDMATVIKDTMSMTMRLAMESKRVTVQQIDENWEIFKELAGFRGRALIDLEDHLAQFQVETFQSVQKEQDILVKKIKYALSCIWAPNLESLERKMSELFTTKVEDPQHLREELENAIREVKGRNWIDVMTEFIGKLTSDSSSPTESGIRSLSYYLSTQSIDDIVKEPLPFDDLVQANLAPQPSPPIKHKVSNGIKNLDRLDAWTKDDLLRARGLKSIGFAKLPAPVAKDSMELDLMGTENDPKEMANLIARALDRWASTIALLCSVTIEGTLKLLTLIGTQTVLDIIKGRILRLSSEAEKAESGQASKSDLEEIIIAQINALCASTAIEETENSLQGSFTQ